ncbi:MAG: hypothetical protein J6A52_07515 [Bacilli bacterium]|nr:hypothetical protein [Bacilli bacterium]
MKETMWIYFFIIIGILGIVIINIFGNVIMSNEQNYYLLKEITEAAMIDAVDLRAIRDGVGWDGVTKETDHESMHCEEGVPGTVRIIKQKFVESFVRRFANSAQLNRKYKILIHDIDECPPKVSVTLIATQELSFITFFEGMGNSDVKYETEADIVNAITSILESKTPNDYD